MGILSAQEIKAKLIDDASRMDGQSLPEEIMAKADKHVEIGTAIRRMVQTTGWKIFEAWLLLQVDLKGLLNASSEDLSKLQAEARTIQRILNQVEYWQRLAERLEREHLQSKAEDL